MSERHAGPTVTFAERVSEATQVVRVRTVKALGVRASWVELR